MSKVQAHKNSTLPYNKENVTKWLKTDFVSIYNISYTIINNPDIIEMIAEKLVAEKEAYDKKKGEDLNFHPELKKAD